MELEARAGASGNIGAAISENQSTVTQEKPDNMVIEATGNVEGVIANSRKNEAEEKTDDMVIETTGRIGAAELDRKRKAEPEDNAAKQPWNLGTVSFGAQDKAGQQLSSSKSTPLSNKPARKRITPIALDP